MKLLLRALPALLVLLLPFAARATHNEAGEITVCYIGNQGQPLYEVTIITHTNPQSPADRPEFVLDWGDNNTDTIPRTDSQVIVVAGISVQRNLYVAQHLYPGPGVYLLQYIDPNRVANVENIPSSVTVPMCVQTELVISVSGNDCTPRFLNAPIQNACLGQPWVHNPGAYDTDGDSLSYETRVCLGGDISTPADGIGDAIPNYRFPDEVAPGANNQYSIDPVTGTITWNSPQQAGIYNIAFAVVEWRRSPNGNRQRIGSVMRDMQVIVAPCDDRPPVVEELRDTCVEAGTMLTFSVQASDPDAGQTITLSALGGPFSVASSPAVFNSSPSQNTVSGVFSWGTNCSHVRQQPYQVVFSARDNYNQVQLQDFATMFITVVAPAPQDPSATPSGTVMLLNWEPEECTNATGYRIYRRQGSYGFTPDHCETGVPAYTGYTLIGSTSGLNSTSYTDSGLAFGITYCYMVVAVFPDGAQSYASVEFCGMLEREVPIMTNVSVVITDVSTGVDSVRWTNARDLDTLQFPGPYVFKVYRGTGFTNATQEVHTSGPWPFLAHPDTVFVDMDIDTRSTAHAYRVELYGDNGATLVGPSNTASSVFLEAAPDDERITLNITYTTPWINTSFEVYRRNGPVWDLIATTTETSYTDNGLVNGQEYCYYVRSIGAYDDPRIIAPLANRSQEVCASPLDLTPPCAPTVVLDNDCEIPLNTLTWNSTSGCASDTYRYNVYFTDSLGGPWQLIAGLIGADNTTFTHTDGSSVAGCYAVTAIDTVGNESALSDTVCGDNCPDYRLPNVFSPNNDRVNDQFIPFPYRGVKEIELHVFNRWGKEMFSTNDPDIQWKGTYQDTGDAVPDGVYYYTCLVTFIRLAGDEPVLLKGYVHILGGKSGSLN